MLTKLRRKFILLNMAMVSVVIIAVFTTIGVVSYQQSLDAAYSAIHESIESASKQTPFGAADILFGTDNDFSNPFDEIGNNTSRKSNDSNDQDASTDDATTSQPHIGGDASSRAVPVAVYRVISSSSFKIISHESTVSLSDDIVSQAAADLYDVTDGEGRLDSLGLLYVKETVLGATYLGFASTQTTKVWLNIVLMMVLIGAGTLLLFFAISVFFSRWALRPVEEAWKKQHQFLADASHELKTPLTVILANTDIILKHPERSVASQEQWLESTQQEALGMQEMVLSMLDLARIDASAETDAANMAQSFERINFSDVVFGSMLQFESIAFERQVDLVDDIDDDLFVKGDQGKLTRLCATLLDNACKYAPAASAITVNLHKKDASTLRNLADTTYQGELPKGEAVVMSIANEGEAISAEDLPHLFDRFYRSDKARTHESSGNSYGLGLAIAASTVISHGGCIMATSTDGVGTTFTAALPVA